MLLQDNTEMATVSLALCSFSLYLKQENWSTTKKFSLLQRLPKVSEYILTRSEIHNPTAGYSASGPKYSIFC